MMIEWECILECNYKCFYCGNGRNDMLESPIDYERYKQKVFDFLDKLKAEFPHEELFIFGGEPFLHPFIEEIIHYMNIIGLRFVIQTNFSRADIITDILRKESVKLQISLHTTEIRDRIKLIKDIRDLQYFVRRIDVMYVGKKSLSLYREVRDVLENKEMLFLAPVADFNIEGVCNHHLYDFNMLKKGAHRAVYQFEKGGRSFNWENQMRGNISYEGSDCLYRDNYVLFDPSLARHTCNYRQTNDVCPNKQCFLM